MVALTGLDARFLQVEDADPHANFAAGALAVLEGPLPDSESLLEALAERLSADRRFKQVVRRYPFDVAGPRMVVVDADVSRHVHHLAVPRPGDDRALFGLVSDVMSWRLHHDDPLWECWVVEGLAESRWAILLKTHSSIADGSEVMRMLLRLSDDDADTETPCSTEHSARMLNPLKCVRGMYRSSAALTVAALRAVTDTVDLTRILARPAACPLTRHVTSLRRYTAVELSLEDVTKVCGAFDVTVRDIALAAISGSYRDLLRRRGRHVHCNSLRALVPTSARSLVAVALPVDESDPVLQLRKAHSLLNRTDELGNSGLGRPPASPTDQGGRALPWLPQRGVVTLTMSELGPRRRRRFIGRETVRLLPIPAVGIGTRSGLAMVSYDGKLVVGVTSDDEALPDVGELAASIEQAVANLSVLSTSACLPGRQG
ncbi:wax ester/triacylglycerol synthase domain-containing protein [Mycolicibacterium sp. XJ1819]